MRKLVSLLLVVFASCGGAHAFAQDVVVRNDSPKTPETLGETSAPEDKKEEKKEEKKDDSSGISLPNTERLRIRGRFMSGYGGDISQSELGYEKQGLVGYFITEVFGKLNNNLSYRLEVNAMNGNRSGVSCGQKDFFYPNSPPSIGPTVVCDNNGRMAVDDYKFHGLDPLVQQQHIRQAYLLYKIGLFGVKFGRFILPIGFDWEEMGSFTAKDAPHIQRINAEASFGFQFSLVKQRQGKPFAEVSFSGVTGDANKLHDYNYFYGLEGSLDSNTWLTGLLSGSVYPVSGLEIRGALKKGVTGSKVERLPNFYASKRNDDAIVLSARYQPHRDVAVFAEKVNYTWGLTATSAELLGLDQSPVKKNGYYVGADLSHQIVKDIRVGTVVTREELSRDDALVKYMSELGMYQAELGKKERSTAIRFYVDFTDFLRVGVYRNDLSNPFPWLSGIAPVSGNNPYKGRGNDKWGVVVRLTVQ